MVLNRATGENCADILMLKLPFLTVAFMPPTELLKQHTGCIIDVLLCQTLTLTTSLDLAFGLVTIYQFPLEQHSPHNVKCTEHEDPCFHLYSLFSYMFLY